MPDTPARDLFDAGAPHSPSEAEAWGAHVSDTLDATVATTDPRLPPTPVGEADGKALVTAGGGLVYGDAAVLTSSDIDDHDTDPDAHQFAHHKAVAATPSAASGDGSVTGTNHGVFLTTDRPVELVSVAINFVNPGTVTLQLREGHSSSGTVLESKEVTDDGWVTVELGWEIPEGDFTLYGEGGASTLFRTDSGVSYPYTTGPLSFVGSTAVVGGNFYYYFYEPSILWLERTVRVPDPTGEPDGKVLVTAGGGLVYEDTDIDTHNIDGLAHLRIAARAQAAIRITPYYEVGNRIVPATVSANGSTIQSGQLITEVAGSDPDPNRQNRAWWDAAGHLRIGTPANVGTSTNPIQNGAVTIDLPAGIPGSRRVLYFCVNSSSTSQWPRFYMPIFLDPDNWVAVRVGNYDVTIRLCIDGEETQLAADGVSLGSGAIGNREFHEFRIEYGFQHGTTSPGVNRGVLYYDNRQMRVYAPLPAEALPLREAEETAPIAMCGANQNGIRLLSLSGGSYVT